MAMICGRTRSMHAGILLSVCVLACGNAASAQSQSPRHAKDVERWLVLPSTTGQSGNPAHAARTAARRLASELEARGKRVLRAEESKRLFEQRGSTAPMSINASDVDALARDAQQALYHVASGLYSRAQQDVERAMQRARKALESLNRETRAARHLLDACMFLVRGHLERGDRDKARRQALECRRLVPDIDPDTTMHPPNVIGVLAEAEADLLSREPSSLRIESEPAGCAVLVNGRNLGTTPKELGRLSAGEYRVQVECDDGEPGRVHRAVLSGNRAVVRVDTRFDRVVQTAFDLSLRYDSNSAERSGRVQDGLEVARAVSASEIVIAWLTDAGTESGPVVAAGRYRVVDGVRLAEARMTLDSAGEVEQGELRDAVRALLEPAPKPVQAVASASASETAGAVHVATSAGARAIEGAAPAARAAGPLDASDVPVEDVLDEPAPVLQIAGLTAGAVGLAANLTGWGLFMRHADLQADYTEALNAQSPERFEAYRQVAGFDLLPAVTLGAGAGVLAASLPLWLPERPGVPAWAWAGGGAGLVAAAAGLKLVFDAGDCLLDDFGRCTQPALATRAGTLLVLQSVPLLALPIVYGVRALSGGRIEGSLSVQARRGALLTLQGQL